MYMTDKHGLLGPTAEHVLGPNRQLNFYASIGSHPVLSNRWNGDTCEMSLRRISQLNTEEQLGVSGCRKLGTCLPVLNTARRSVHGAYLAMACYEVVSETGARRRLGFDGVNGEAVRYELNQGRPVAGHQHLVGPQPQGQLCFLKTMHNSQFSVEQTRSRLDPSRCSVTSYT